MSRPYSLSYLTYLDLAPPHAVEVASKAGYDYLGLRLLPAVKGGVCHPLMDNPQMLAETLAIMRGTGVEVFDLEMIRLQADFNVEDYRSFFEIGQKLGARAVLIAGDDEDRSRLIDSFAQVCEAAQPYRISAQLEFMPQTNVRNIKDAITVLEKSGGNNCGIIFDSLHFARSGSTLDDLKSIPREWLAYAQICDGPEIGPDTIEGLNYAARHERLLPGDGELDLRQWFSLIPANIPISVEVPNDKQAPEYGALNWSRKALAMSKAILGDEAAKGTALS
ncbi:TIM barrel protein [Agrobacterium vitis]|uniref:sugar phosphate isomerase/epimerase family protein n=1 Tax=Agrobacterium vitis TaxID=373 RepID=UPI0012E763B4|nr:sugar phosphate isomerase/epimerase [Agrobacterium vitis]MVA22043.1 TIM barrel protein [Agrobacterium vitis]